MEMAARWIPRENPAASCGSHTPVGNSPLLSELPPPHSHNRSTHRF